ncbi:hypothetical protein HY030_02870 [Candidatus Gottesmanbacteria bacterium]|nr:hypothetical protein [Candidatus Gottesmanbacteria bacterium]
MQKRYLCLRCYSFHPEMRGVSEEEFLAGDNVCKEEKCIRKGQLLEAAYFCQSCEVMYPAEEAHVHKKK